MVKFTDEIEDEKQEIELTKKVKELKENLNKEKAKRSAIKAKYQALLSCNEKSINRSCASIDNKGIGLSKIENMEKVAGRLKEEIKEIIQNKADAIETNLRKEIIKVKDEVEQLKKFNKDQKKISIENKRESYEEARSNLAKNKSFPSFLKNPSTINHKQELMEKFENYKLDWAKLDSRDLLFHSTIFLNVPRGFTLINTEMVLDLIKKREISDIGSWISTKSWILRPNDISFSEAKESSNKMTGTYFKDWNTTFNIIFKNPSISLEQCQFKWGALLKYMNIERNFIQLKWFPGYPWYIQTITLFEDSFLKKDSFIQKLKENKINFEEKVEGEIAYIELKNELSDPKIFLKKSKKYELVDGNIENATNLWNSIKNLI